ncbi:hypothetical protein [Saccharopolyspora sp. NPDC002376]
MIASSTLVLVGVASSWLRQWIGAALGVAAAVLLMIGQSQVRYALLAGMKKSDPIPDTLPEAMFHSRFGYWLCVVLLFGIATHNIVEMVRTRRTPPPG